MIAPTVGEDIQQAEPPVGITPTNQDIYNDHSAFRCIYDLAANQGVFKSIHNGNYSPEDGKIVIKNVISNLQDILVRMNVNQIRSVLKKLKEIRRKISDEVWDARLPGNGSVPFDYHQQRRAQFGDLINDLPVPTLGNLHSIIPNLINLLVLDVHYMHVMVDQGGRHKVINVLDCIIRGITLYSNLGGGRKKTIRRKTHKNKKRKKKSMRYKKRN
jgi:predicted ribosome-associated RNA-binding protein Tma20